MPLLVVFAAGASLHQESDRRSDLPMHRNGPPGTFVHVPGVRVSLPTDQIVVVETVDGELRVGFGGMRFDGVADGRLTFTRVRDLLPEEQLSPDRSWTMTLEPEWVARVEFNGEVVWRA
jgi:hypothetical protein